MSKYSYLPDDLDLKDNRSPETILKTLIDELRQASKGLIKGEMVVDGEGDRRAITVRLTNSQKRSWDLLTVENRPEHDFPLRVNWDDEYELPDFLKKEYYEEGAMRSSVIESVGSIGKVSALFGTTVKNRWVAETPSEFDALLRKVMSASSIKMQLIDFNNGGTDSSNPQEE